MYNTLGQASYTSNLRLVHSKFDNIFFDGIDSCTIKHSGGEQKLKLKNKTDFAKQFKVEDVMNFPFDDRSPVIKIHEMNVEGE